MGRPAHKVPFIVIFFAMGFLLSLLFAGLFLHALESDDVLSVYLIDWRLDPQVSFSVAQFLLSPVYCILVAVWWILWVRTKRFVKPQWLTVRNTVAFVLAVVALNSLALVFLRSSFTEEFQASASGRVYLLARSVGLSPTFVIADLVFVAASLGWVFKPYDRPVNEIDRLGILAMSLGSLGALLMASSIKL